MIAVESWEEFVCVQCARHTETLTFLLMGDTGQNPEGPLMCPMDNADVNWLDSNTLDSNLKEEFKSDEVAWKEIKQQDLEAQKNAPKWDF
jgi:hypothetical protein